MKTLVLAVLLIGATAQADIVAPPETNYSSTELDGDGAAGLYNALPGDEQRGDSLRTSFSMYKVLRAENGLSEAVCFKRVSSDRGPVGRGRPSPPRRRESFDCEIKTSTDGREVPRYVHRRRLG